jgi:hypothetical protein
VSDAALRAEDAVAIGQLLALYGHLVDRGELDRLGEVFTDDATFDGSAELAGASFGGLDELRRFFAPQHPPHPPSHNTLGTVVTVHDGVVRALSKWLAIDRGSGHLRSGDYEDELVQTPDGWRIRKRVVVCRWWVGPTAMVVDTPGPPDSRGTATR